MTLSINWLDAASGSRALVNSIDMTNVDSDGRVWRVWRVRENNEAWRVSVDGNELRSIPNPHTGRTIARQWRTSLSARLAAYDANSSMRAPPAAESKGDGT